MAVNSGLDRSRESATGRVSLGRGYVGRPVPDDPGWVVTAVTHRQRSRTDRTADCAATGVTVRLDDDHVHVTARRSTDHVEATRTYVLANERALEGWFG